MNYIVVSSFSVSSIYVIISILAAVLIYTKKINNSTRNMAIVLFIGLIPMICSLTTYFVLEDDKDKEKRNNILNIMTIVFSILVIVFIPLVYRLSDQSTGKIAVPSTNLENNTDTNVNESE